MKLVTIDHIPGKEYEVLGIAKGTIVHSKNIGRDFMAGMKTIVGGEIKGYTEMLNEARQIATKRMVEDAESLGADAVVGVRYGSSMVMQGAAEIVAYGTAVKFVYRRMVLDAEGCGCGKAAFCQGFAARDLFCKADGRTHQETLGE